MKRGRSIISGLTVAAALAVPGTAAVVLVASTASSAQTTTTTTTAVTTPPTTAPTTTTVPVTTTTRVVLVPPGPATFTPATTTTLAPATPAASSATTTPADQLSVTGTCFSMFELQDLAAQAANAYATMGPGAPPAGVIVNGKWVPAEFLYSNYADFPTCM